MCHLILPSESIWQCASSLSYCKTETVEHQWILLKWMVDYQTDRSQCIGVEGTTSLSQPVFSSVPQGSVLGSLLFIIYNDDLTNALSNRGMSPYADDLLLYRTIQSPSDYQTLQAEIEALSDWISPEKLQLNCDKCKYMLVTRKRDSTMSNASLINSQSLKKVYSYNYLGILLTSDLFWSAHVSTLCSKAWQQIGMFYHKYYRYSDVDTLKQLYVAFIHPHLQLLFGTLTCLRTYRNLNHLLTDNCYRKKSIAVHTNL